MTDEELEELYGTAFSIVAMAGEAKSHAYRALDLSEMGQFDEAEQALKACDIAFKEAHHSQTQLIQKEVNGQQVHISVLLIHSQDHLMTAISEKELIKRMIKMNHRLFYLEQHGQER